MIRKSRSSPWKKIGSLIIIPVFGLFIWASAKPNYILVQESFPVQDMNDSARDIVIKIDSLPLKTQGQIIKITKADKAKGIKNEEKTTIRILGMNTKDSVLVRNEDNNIEVRRLIKPLVIIDGQKVDYEKMSELNLDEIGSISVLKDQSATSIYGEGGKNGILLITTKSYIKNSRTKDNNPSSYPK
jgi:TonB-dependent SusC/RagA subfamily outer membrane receptor